MMQNTLVKMNEILDEKDCRLNSRVFHAQVGDPSFLVLEDLGARGFRLANRQLGLDRDHCVLVMRRLARFHASSIALYEKVNIFIVKKKKKTRKEIIKKQLF